MEQPINRWEKRTNKTWLFISTSEKIENYLVAVLPKEKKVLNTFLLFWSFSVQALLDGGF